MQTVQTVATIAIALFAVVIALGQWWTARQKLALDLFEKRFQLFLEVRRIASEATQNGKLSDYGLPNEIIARSRFLFGEDINEAVRKLHDLTVQLQMRDPKASQQIDDLYDQMLPMFSQYMEMKQTLPTLRFW